MKDLFRVVTEPGQIPAVLATGPDGHRDPPYVNKRQGTDNLHADLLGG